MIVFFSIIIPVYNVEKYLRDCLNSVFEQEFTDYEVICVNDGSTDNSLQILREYEQKYTNLVVIDQPNGGLSVARNEGIKCAKGNYVFLLDSDDWIEGNTLEILSNHIAGQDMICFNGRRFFEGGRTEEPDEGIVEEKLIGWEYYNKYALVSRKFHFVCAVLRLYRREFLLKNNLFFQPGIYHEDNLFTPIACYYAGKVSVIPEVLYVYRIRKGSITQTLNFKRLSDIIQVANQLADFFIPKTDIDKLVIYREIAGEFFSVFMSPKADAYGKDNSKVKKLIDWEKYKQVSIYPRHKRIYRLLKIHPAIFRTYIEIEQLLKKKK